MGNASRRRTVAMVLAVLLVVAGVVVLVAEPVTGRHLLTVTPGHGVDAGDLLAIPFFVAAALTAWWGLAK